MFVSFLFRIVLRIFLVIFASVERTCYQFQLLSLYYYCCYYFYHYQCYGQLLRVVS